MDVYGRGIEGVRQGWGAMLRGVGEGVEGILQGVEMGRIRREKRAKEDFEKELRKANTTITEFLHAMRTIKTPEAWKEYTEGFSQEEYDKIRRITAKDLQRLGEANLIELEKMQAQQMEALQHQREMLQMRLDHGIDIEEARRKTRLEVEKLKETPIDEIDPRHLLSLYTTLIKHEEALQKNAAFAAAEVERRGRWGRDFWAGIVMSPEEEMALEAAEEDLEKAKKAVKKHRDLTEGVKAWLEKTMTELGFEFPKREEAEREEERGTPAWQRKPGVEELLNYLHVPFEK